MKRGMLFSTDSMAGSRLPDFVEQIERAGFDSLWLPELFGRDPFVAAGALLHASQRLRVCTGIANVYARDAIATKGAALTLSELSGGRFELGLGVSNKVGNRARGHDWQPPLNKLDAFFTAMEEAPMRFETPHPVPVYLAAHGPKLMDFAIRRADGAMTYMATRGHNEEARKVLGPDKKLIVVQTCLVEEDEDKARKWARRAVSIYLPIENYHRAWMAQGFDRSDFSSGGSDRFVDELVAWGSLDAVRGRIEECRQMGVDEVVLIPLNANSKEGPDMGVMRELLAA
ncbi:MAG: LLM class flavin-dependent oxidoreductase [Myxococcota bacterium]|nr:LLM class flavin-dependent oxidoreductase [Myxococcota bacterium]